MIVLSTRLKPWQPLLCDAGQLEQLGLWEWSVFVLLNVQNQELRRRSVCSVLERNVTLVTDEAEESSKEAWLVAELGVPPAWVAAARAVLARTLGNYTQLADQLILAGQWNEAHKVKNERKRYQRDRDAVLAQTFGNHTQEFNTRKMRIWILFFFL